MPAQPNRVYVPARIQLEPPALLVADADGVEQLVERATIAIVENRLCLVADYIAPSGNGHVVEIGGCRITVNRTREWDYRVDDVLGV